MLTKYDKLKNIGGKNQGVSARTEACAVVQTMSHRDPDYVRHLRNAITGQDILGLLSSLLIQNRQKIFFHGAQYRLKLAAPAFKILVYPGTFLSLLSYQNFVLFHILWVWYMQLYLFAFLQYKPFLYEDRVFSLVDFF